MIPDNFRSLITAFGQMHQAFGELGFLPPPPSSSPSSQSTVNSKMDLGESCPSSPLQPRPSPCLLRRVDHHHPPLKQATLPFQPSQHWSRRQSEANNPLLQETPMPMCKVRRTLSECLPLPTSPSRSQSGLGEVIRLPCHTSPKDAIKRLTPDTGHWHHLYQRLLIIDCRYPYEYEGGHLPGAINVNTLEAIDEMLFAAAEGMADTILVFHCEFSSERAPRMALHVRNKDRLLNAHRYPHLQYPEVYILEGGYKNFFLTHPDHCEPAGCYMPMRNPKHREELRFHQRMKHTMLGGQKHRTKLRTVSLGSLAMGKAVRNADWQMPHFVPSQEALHAMDICYDENMPSSDGLEISCNATYHL